VVIVIRQLYIIVILWCKMRLCYKCCASWSKNEQWTGRVTPMEGSRRHVQPTNRLKCILSNINSAVAISWFLHLLQQLLVAFRFHFAATVFHFHF